MPADPQSASRARRIAREACRGRLPTDVVDSVELLVGEVVANAVVHARSHCTILVEPLADTGVRVEVADAAPELPTHELAGEEETAGRGLAIVDALARKWGFTPSAEGGKVVWFEAGPLEVEAQAETAAGAQTESLVDRLADAAFAAACLPAAHRPPPDLVSKRLAELADGDHAALTAAWDRCVNAFAEGESLSWLLSATYFIPAVIRDRGFDSARHRPPAEG